MLHKIKTKINLYLMAIVALTLISLPGCNEAGKETSIYTGDYYSDTRCDNKFNNLILYQVYVAAYQDGDSSIGYTMGYGPGRTGGDLQGIINAIPHIKNLGINSLWMTPVFESTSGNTSDTRGASTGYFADDFFKIDPHFGSEATFGQLIDQLHNNNIYAILDGVFGHSGGDISESDLSPEGNSVSFSGSQWYGHSISYPESLDYYNEVVKYWVNNYDVDGWRLDQSYQLYQDNTNYWTPIVTAYDALVEQRKTGGETWGTLGLMVGEHFTSDVNDINIRTIGSDSAPALNSCFDFQMMYKLIDVLTGVHNATELHNGLAITENDYSSHAAPAMFLTNHDVQRLGGLLVRRNVCEYNSTEYWNRHKLAFSFLASYTGPITLYYGDEYGDYTPNYVDGVSPNQYCHDDNISRSSGKISGFSTGEQDLINYVKEVLSIRSSHSALYNGARRNLISANYIHADLKSDGTEKIIYIFNNSESSSTITLDHESIGGSSLNDLQSGEIIPGDGSYDITISGLTARFLIVQ